MCYITDNYDEWNLANYKEFMDRLHEIFEKVNASVFTVRAFPALDKYTREKQLVEIVKFTKDITKTYRTYDVDFTDFYGIDGWDSEHGCWSRFREGC